MIPPKILTYITTFRCNARCVMCDSWKKDDHDELTLGELERIFSSFPKLHMVKLSGGEPFLRNDFREIHNTIIEKTEPRFVQIISNGFLTEKIILFFETRKMQTPLRLLISLDGVKEKHNKVRGVANAWKFAEETIKRLAPLQKKLNFKLAVNQTIIDEQGIEQYYFLRDYLKQYDVKNYFVIGYDASSMYSVDNEKITDSQIGSFSSYSQFPEETLHKFFDDQKTDVKNLPFDERLAKNYYLKGIKNRMLKNVNSPNPECTALYRHIRMLPDGKVPVCQFNTSTVGDLRKNNLEEILSTDLYEVKRNWVINCTGCWAECEVLPSAFYSGDIVLNKFKRAPKVLQS